LKQLGLGIHNYESSNGALPPQEVLSFDSTGAVIATSKTQWGPTSRIAPFLELGTLYNSINYLLKTTDPTNTTVAGATLKVMICPSEVNQQPFVSGTNLFGVSNYGWCEGDWYVWGGKSGTQNRSAFSVNVSRPFSAVADGLSQTVFASEVKAYTFSYHDCTSV